MNFDWFHVSIYARQSSPVKINLVSKRDMVEASQQHAKFTKLRQQLTAMNQELQELKDAEPHASMKTARNDLAITLSPFLLVRPRCNVAIKYSATALYEILHEKEASWRSNCDIENYLASPEVD